MEWNFDKLRSNLDKDGFLLVKNFFSDHEISELRNLAEKYINIETDVFSIDEISKIILNKKYLEFISNLFGKNLVYWGNSSIYGKVQEKTGSFHEDARGIDTLSYKNTYPLFRSAIFLQDHHIYSEGIKFRVGSHKKQLVKFFPLYNFNKFLKCLIRGEIKIKDLLFKGNIINIRSTKNDLIIWNMKLHHCGRFKMLKIFPKISLNPFFEKILPKILFKNIQKKRLGIFVAYGKKSLELDKFIEDDYKRRKNFFENMKSIRNNKTIVKFKQYDISVQKFN